MKSVDGIDWVLLYKQKLCLLRVIDRHYGGCHPLLDGLAELLDEMGDEAEELGLFVYPKED